MSRRKLRIAGIVLAVIAAAVAVAGIVTRAADNTRLRERAEAQAVPTVAVIAPGNSGDAGALELPGRLEAYSRAPIYARVSGYLKSWKVDIGTPVKAGQLLAEIETPDLDQQLLQAKADLASAQANAALAGTTAKRWQSMLGSDSVSRQEAEEKAGDFTTKQAMVNAAQANVDRVLAMKGFTRIVAPFDGIVTARTTDVGALINAGSGAGPELFVVSDTRKLRVYVSVPQSYASIVKVGAKAKLTVPEQPGKSYAATVESSSRAVNVASGSMLIQLAVDNAAAELLPGGFASVSLELPRNAGRTEHSAQRADIRQGGTARRHGRRGQQGHAETGHHRARSRQGDRAGLGHRGRRPRDREPARRHRRWRPGARRRSRKCEKAAMGRK